MDRKSESKLTVSAGTPRLLIQQIRNSNPSWVRRDMGDLQELESSLNDAGMVSPVLLDRSFLVVDGARRVAAAERLGWDSVPVLITDDWAMIKNYFLQCRELEKLGWPHKEMLWLEINDLDRRILTKLYEPRRRSLTGKRVKADSKTPRPSTTHYVQEIREMLGLMDRAGGYINTIKDLGSCVRRAYELDKGLGDQVTNLVNHANVAGRGLHGTLGITRRMVNEAHVVHHPSDLKEAQEQADLIARMTQVIHQVGVEARSLKSINPAMSAEVARALRGGTRTAVRSLYKWRKTIEEYTKEAEEREALNGQHEERDQQADVQ